LVVEGRSSVSEPETLVVEGRSSVSELGSWLWSALVGLYTILL